MCDSWTCSEPVHVCDGLQRWRGGCYMCYMCYMCLTEPQNVLDPVRLLLWSLSKKDWNFSGALQCVSCSGLRTGDRTMRPVWTTCQWWSPVNNVVNHIRGRERESEVSSVCGSQIHILSLQYHHFSAFVRCFTVVKLLRSWNCGGAVWFKISRSGGRINANAGWDVL